MKRLIASILLACLICTQAFGFGWPQSMQGGGIGWGAQQQSPFLVNLPLSSNLGGKVVGGLSFSRPSVQWGTDDTGKLVQVGFNTPFFNSKGVLLEPASQNKCTCYGAIPADSLGSEKITNGDFSGGASGWTLGTGWSVAGGIATATNSPDLQPIYEPFAPVAGRVYEVRFTVLTCTSGGFAPRIGGTSGTTRNTPGTYTERVVSAGATTAGGVTPVGTTSGSITNISVKEVQFAVGTKSFYTGGAWSQNHTNMTLSGDTAAVLTTVDDTAALTAAGLSGICSSGKVYKLDNSLGTATAYVISAGSAGNTNTHIASAFVRSNNTGSVGGVFVAGVSGTTYSGPISVYTNKNSSALTAVAGGQFQISANAGKVVYFILPQFEESLITTGPMPCQGATATRAITALQFPAFNNCKGNDVSVYMELTVTSIAPSPAYPDVFIVSKDGNNKLSIAVNQFSSKLYAQRYVAGTQATMSPSGPALTAGSTYKVIGRWSSITGIDIFVNGAKTGSVNSGVATSTTDLSGATAVFHSGLTALSRQVKNLRIYRRPLSDAQCIALTQ